MPANPTTKEWTLELSDTHAFNISGRIWEKIFPPKIRMLYLLESFGSHFLKEVLHYIFILLFITRGIELRWSLLILYSYYFWVVCLVRFHLESLPVSFSVSFLQWHYFLGVLNHSIIIRPSGLGNAKGCILKIWRLTLNPNFKYICMAAARPYLFRFLCKSFCYLEFPSICSAILVQIFLCVHWEE